VEGERKQGGLTLSEVSTWNGHPGWAAIERPRSRDLNRVTNRVERGRKATTTTSERSRSELLAERMRSIRPTK
jgi:hypothetical protein